MNEKKKKKKKLSNVDATLLEQVAGGRCYFDGRPIEDGSQLGRFQCEAGQWSLSSDQQSAPAPDVDHDQDGRTDGHFLSSDNGLTDADNSPGD